jgi:hypothetical protein
MLHRVAAAIITVATGTVLLTAPVAARVLLDHDPGEPSPVTATVTTAPDACGVEPSDAAGWQRLFSGQSGAWSGADGATSVRLPDGRLLWLFGDTFVGGVGRDGVRADDTRIVRNSVIVTEGTCVRPLPTTTDALRGRRGTWLWPSHAVVTSAARRGGTSTVVVFAQRMRRTGDGTWDFARVGTAAVTFSVPWHGTPVVRRTTDLPDHGVGWGASLVRDGATTWVYGSLAVPGEFGRALMLARAPTASVTDVRTWSYRTAGGWSSSWRAAVPVRSAHDGVSTVPSVARVGGLYVVVTKAHEFLDPQVVALSAPMPWGPWTEQPLFAAASSTRVLRYSPALVASSTGRRLVVVVSRTSTSLALLHGDATIAYPTFADVTLKP